MRTAAVIRTQQQLYARSRIYTRTAAVIRAQQQHKLYTRTASVIIRALQQQLYTHTATVIYARRSSCTRAAAVKRAA